MTMSAGELRPWYTTNLESQTPRLYAAGMNLVDDLVEALRYPTTWVVIVFLVAIVYFEQTLKKRLAASPVDPWARRGWSWGSFVLCATVVLFFFGERFLNQTTAFCGMGFAGLACLPFIPFLIPLTAFVRAATVTWGIFGLLTLSIVSMLLGANGILRARPTDGRDLLAYMFLLSVLEAGLLMWWMVG